MILAVDVAGVRAFSRAVGVHAFNFSTWEVNAVHARRVTGIINCGAQLDWKGTIRAHMGLSVGKG